MYKGLDELPWNNKGTENCYREQNRKCEYLYLNPRFLLQFSKRCKLLFNRKIVLIKAPLFCWC